MTKKIIRLSDFKELTEVQQFEIMHADGVYIGKRIVGNQMAVLFQVYGFYVEIYYKEYRKEIDHIESSDSTDIIAPYIDQVNVRDLNKGN